jgi:hypothetical protein
MWIVTNDETGAIVTGPVSEAPTAGEGETLRRVPITTRWSVTKRAFVDDARWVTKFEYQRLWPKPAIAAVMNSAHPEMAAAWASFLTWEGLMNLDDEEVQGGIDLAAFLEILTADQAQRIKDGLPPL